MERTPKFKETTMADKMKAEFQAACSGDGPTFPLPRPELTGPGDRSLRGTRVTDIPSRRGKGSWFRDEWKRPAMRLALTAVCALACMKSAPSQVLVKNHNQVPRWNQHHDYRTAVGGVTYAYDGRDSPIPAVGGNITTGPFVKYSDLAVNGRTKFDLVTPEFYLAATGRAWVAGDYYRVPARVGYDLAGGGWYCMPTSTGMWFEWLRANVLSQLGARGGEVPSIDDFAFNMNVNQLRTHPFNGRGHFGGFRGDGIHAANQYISVTYNGILNLVFGPRVSAWNYSKTAYTRMIDRNKPMVVFYETLDANKQPTGWGHGVVGVGYFGAYAVVRDPADALQKGKPFNMIRQLDDGLGTGTYFGVGDPPSAGFDLEWTRARLHVADVADFGDAPSSYEPSPSNFAGHQSGDREWLGPNISGEVDPDSPIDDPDGVANRTDQDQFDDGVVFTEFDQINGIQGVITVSSLADMSLDSAFEVDQPPTLFVDGWIDWNQDLTWSDPAERIVQWSGPADFQGTLTIPFSSPMPSGYAGLTWARFRLSRGAPSGPLGFSRFGEVEDYVCSYQLTLSATGLVAGGNATIAVSGATPGGTVRHGYSTTGGGPIGTPWGSLLLSPPYTELPAMTIDASGSGSFSGSVPPGTTGIAVWLHAFDLGSLTFSNGVATTIG